MSASAPAATTPWASAAIRWASDHQAPGLAGSAGVIVNLSVWTDTGHLGAFVFGEMHRQVLHRRREWFQRMREAQLACWWVPAGHHPGTGEAEDRVRHLRAHGPTPYAFTLRVSYPPPGGAGERPVRGPVD